jgi:hypothetical protein
MLVIPEVIHTQQFGQIFHAVKKRGGRNFMCHGSVFFYFFNYLFIANCGYPIFEFPSPSQAGIIKLEWID